jgi:hypothetical protein
MACSGTPPNSIRPAKGRCKPAIVRINVLLPCPFLPMMA